jgi:hypothetical protein
MLGITTTNVRVGGFRGGISAEAKTIYNRIIADGGVSNLSRLNFFVKGLKAIYGDLANVPVCYDAHWIGYKLGSGTGATAGQAAAKLYSLTVAGDAVQTTAASQPLLLSHNGASSDNYWYGSGVTGNYVQSNSLAPIGSTQLDVKIKVLAGAGTVVSKCIVSQDSAGVTNRIFSVEWADTTTGTITFFFNNSFATSVTSSAGIGFVANYSGWIRATYSTNGVTGTVTFYSSTDGTTWTALGTPQTAASTALGISNAVVTVGSNAGVGNFYTGKVQRVLISGTIGGAATVDFNPATYNASTSQTQWTSTTGEIWTINTGTATTGYKGVLVDRTIVQSDGVDDVISVAISGNAIRTQYIAHKSLGASSGSVGGLFLTAANAQAFSYNSNKYNFYQQGAFDGPFGAVVIGTTNRALRISGAVGGTGTNWIPFQNGVDVSNGGANIGLATSYNILTLFSRGNITSFDNAIFNTYIMSSVADNLTIRTATQAFAKTLNNNI